MSGAADTRLRDAVTALESVATQLTPLIQSLETVVREHTDQLGRWVTSGPTPADELMAELSPHVHGLRGGVADLRATMSTAISAEIARIVVSLPGEPSIPRSMRYTRKKRLRMAPMAFGTGKGRQGDAPNCSFHAAIAMLTDADPRAVSRAVRRDAHAGTVRVRTAAGDHHLEDTLPVWRPTNQLLYGTTDDGSPLVPYLEKAWAKYRGGYQNMKAGPHRVFTWFTGRPSHVDGVRNFSSADLRHLATDRSKPLVAGSVRRPAVTSLSAHLRYRTLAARYGVIQAGNHSYGVTGVDEEGNYLLYNPAGYHHPKPMPEVVFRQLFIVLSWCDLKEAPR